MRRESVSICANNRADNDERDTCSGCPTHQEGASADLVNEQKCWDSAEAIDDAVDSSC